MFDFFFFKLTVGEAVFGVHSCSPLGLLKTNSFKGPPKTS